MERTGILENIVSIRKAKGYSQDYLASKIGMKQAGYGLIETGARGLQFDLLLRIAVALEVDVIDIITYPRKYVEQGAIPTASPGVPRARLSVEVEVGESELRHAGIEEILLRSVNGGNPLKK